MKEKIIFLTELNPNDKHSWSGTHYNCKCQLERFYHVDCLWIKDDLIDKIVRLFYRVIFKIFGKNAYYSFSDINSKRKGHRINRLLKDFGGYKAIFLLGCNLGAYIRTNIPILYYTDATFHLLEDYYFVHLSTLCRKSGNHIQRLAMEKASWCLFASEWARKNAIQYYGISANKCFIGKLGANVDTVYFSKQNHEKHLVNLLFIGVNWKRKGGDIAVDCIQELSILDPSRHYVLHMVGADFPFQGSNIKKYGFLNRNNPKQQKQLIALREQADIFILPTKSECAGIVFCEASAYGIPSITYDTGGVGDYVINGENGYRLPLNATGKDFANKIIEILADNNQLKYMQKRSVEIYHKELNWNTLGDIFHSLID